MFQDASSQTGRLQTFLFVWSRSALFFLPKPGQNSIGASRFRINHVRGFIKPRDGAGRGRGLRRGQQRGRGRRDGGQPLVRQVESCRCFWGSIQIKFLSLRSRKPSSWTALPPRPLRPAPGTAAWPERGGITAIITSALEGCRRGSCCPCAPRCHRRSSSSRTRCCFSASEEGEDGHTCNKFIVLRMIQLK